MGISRQKLKAIYNNFSEADAKRIKEIEKTTQHDVGAVIEFLKEKVDKETGRFIHFGLTSEDINNLAYGLMLKEAVNLYLKVLKTAILKLTEYAEKIQILHNAFVHSRRTSHTYNTGERICKLCGTNLYTV